MAIEPLGSVMTAQAQSAIPQKQETAVKQETAAYTVQPVEKVDKVTSVVENAQGKGQQNSTAADHGQEQLNNAEQIRKAVERLNKNLEHSEAVYGIHEGTNRVMIKIVDRDTREVIKELPPEKTLDMIAKVWELAGILVDERR